jgi:hypothetical protein
MNEPKTIVSITAVDWAIYTEQMPVKSEFKMIRGDIVGFLVQEDDDKIVLAMQWFQDGDIRPTLVVPKVCILTREDFTL